MDIHELKEIDLLLKDVEKWLISNIGELPDLDDDWEDGHSELSKIQLARRSIALSVDRQTPDQTFGTI